MQLQRSNIKTVLCIYGASQTYTSTVFEHLDSFGKYSRFSWAYLDIAVFNNNVENIDSFDAVVLHYSVRLPFGQVSKEGLQKLHKFRGLRVLFIQDEYDSTNAAKKIIGSVPFDLVFSVVPSHSLQKIYPSNEFHQTRFVSNFTGYVPDQLIGQMGNLLLPSRRSLFVAYRGRPLPVRYGRLGQEKVAIGHHVKNYCRKHGITCDIEWDESSRIYGEAWYKFIGSAKAMLGSESGSNVFDWNGDLQQVIDCYRKDQPNATDKDIYRNIIEDREVDGLMNQVSPRIFEMAAARTVMILFEGAYSGVLVPNIHYLPLKKDFSNIDTVFATLADDEAVDAMVARTYCDIIESNKYSYKQFVNRVDAEMLAMLRLGRQQREDAAFTLDTVNSRHITEAPIRSRPPLPSLLTQDTVPFLMPLKRLVAKGLIAGWQKVPMSLRPHVKRLLGRT